MSKRVIFYSQFDSRFDVRNLPIEVPCHENDSIDTILDIAFSLQGNNFDGKKVHADACSMSVGDVVEVERQPYFLDGMGRGWMPMTHQQFKVWRESEARDRSWLGSDWFGSGV